MILKRDVINCITGILIFLVGATVSRIEETLLLGGNNITLNTGHLPEGTNWTYTVTGLDPPYSLSYSTDGEISWIAEFNTTTLVVPINSSLSQICFKYEVLFGCHNNATHCFKKEETPCGFTEATTFVLLVFTLGQVVCLVAGIVCYNLKAMESSRQSFMTWIGVLLSIFLLGDVVIYRYEEMEDSLHKCEKIMFLIGVITTSVFAVHIVWEIKKVPEMKRTNNMVPTTRLIILTVVVVMMGLVALIRFVIVVGFHKGSDFDVLDTALLLFDSILLCIGFGIGMAICHQVVDSRLQKTCRNKGEESNPKDQDGGYMDQTSQPLLEITA